MKLSRRFALDNLILVGGVLLVVSAVAFSSTVAGWLAFGVSAGLAATAGASAIFARSMERKAGHGMVSLIALWSVVAALLFTGPALTWLVLANGLALAVAALVDLAAHEMTTERVVHQLEVRNAPAERAAPAEAVAA